MRSCTFIDPNAETVLQIVNMLLYKEQRGAYVNWEYVKYIDCASSEYLPSMNLLNDAAASPEHIQFETLALIKDVFEDSGASPQLDNVLTTVIGGLLAKVDDPTILDAIRLLREDSLWERMGQRMTAAHEQGYLDFFRSPLAKSERIAPDNRLSLFRSEKMQGLFGRAENELDYATWINAPYMILVNTKTLGDRENKLIVGTLVKRLFEAILRRGGGGSHFLFIEEEKQLQLEILKRFNSELRKFGGVHIGATQDYGLLNKSFRDNIEGNTGNFLMGKQSRSESQSAVAKLISMRDSPLKDADIATLANLNMYLRTTGTDGKGVLLQVQATPIPWMRPNGKPARHPNSQRSEYDQTEAQKEVEEAKAWTLEKALELQKRDWKSRAEIQVILDERGQRKMI